MQSSFRDVRSLAAIAICLALAAPAAAAPPRSIAEARMGGGALDRLLPVANQHFLAAALPNARLRVYPDAAHGFIVQHQRAHASGRSLPAGEGAAPSDWQSITAILRRSRLEGTRTARAGTSSGS
jgi:pimeloyl-ACP methyl ester carboxylesterase